MNVLVAHGDELLCSGIGCVLDQRLSDTHVVEVSNFADCFARLINNPPTDLLMLDLRLPGFARFDGLRSLRARWPDLPVIAVVERDNPAAARRALDSGATTCLAPSDSAEDLLAAVRVALAGPPSLPPWAARDDASPAPRARARTITAQQLEALTSRQREVLDLLSQGISNKEIAAELKVAEGTIRIHVAAILKTLGLHNRTQAALAALRSGLTD